MLELKSYHMPTLEQEGKLCLLLQKIYKAGKKAVVLFSNTEDKESADKKLWTFSQSAFIPHGVSVGTGNPESDKKENEVQPILLTQETKVGLISGRETIIIFATDDEMDFVQSQVNNINNIISHQGKNRGQDEYKLENIIFFIGYRESKINKQLVEQAQKKLSQLAERCSDVQMVKQHIFEEGGWKTPE